MGDRHPRCGSSLGNRLHVLPDPRAYVCGCSMTVSSSPSDSAKDLRPIRVRDIGKMYTIESRPHTNSLYDSAARLVGRRERQAEGGKETVWALRNVTFDVQ